MPSRDYVKPLCLEIDRADENIKWKEEEEFIGEAFLEKWVQEENLTGLTNRYAILYLNDKFTAFHAALSLFRTYLQLLFHQWRGTRHDDKFAIHF
jgi:hypothetical protein